MMIMPDFDSIESLSKYIQNNIDDVLDKEVSQIVKAQEQVEIQSKVYDVYPHPIGYIRREYNGGLIDDLNMKHTVQNGELVVTNETPINEDYSIGNNGMTLNEMVITGKGYDYPSCVHNPYPYEQPRDYIQATEDELKENNVCTETLKIGLNNNGIPTE